jgi:hypothetical protein
MFRALWELARYDLVRLTLGFQYLYRGLERQRIASPSGRSVTEAVICDAVSLAACFYVKPVLCLQRSIVAARLLRKHSIAAQLVIGYRPAPFLSHAWVEVDGRVVNDSPGYKQRLQVLSRA